MPDIELVEWLDHDGNTDPRDGKTPQHWMEWYGFPCRFWDVGYLLGETDDYIVIGTRRRHDGDGDGEDYYKTQRILKATIVKRTKLVERDGIDA